MSVENIRWVELGFSVEESEVLATSQRDPEGLTFAVELSTWKQWVTEFERGELLTMDEVESAWVIRDEVEASCSIIGVQFRERIYRFLDELDLKYREATVATMIFPEVSAGGLWWRGRVPMRNAARRYLYDME